MRTKGIITVMKELVIVMGILSFLTGCHEREPNGGSNTYVDSKASKEISSTDLISFNCRVSTVSMSDIEEGLVYGWYDFSLETDENTGEITGGYSLSESHSDLVSPEFSFKTDKAFAEKVQKIIEESKIVSQNGVHHKTNGIPEEFGYDLRAVYASGEKISCSDNQDSWINDKIIKKLYDLYYKESGAEAYYDTDELLSVYYYVYERDKYTLWSYAYKNPEGTYTCKVTESIEKKQTPYGEKSVDKEFMDRISTVFKENDMAEIQEFPRREGDRHYTLTVKFGKEIYTVISNSAISDPQYEALVGLQDLFLDMAKKS